MEYPQIFSFLYVKELSRHPRPFPIIPGPDRGSSEQERCHPLPAL